MLWLEPTNSSRVKPLISTNASLANVIMPFKSVRVTRMVLGFITTSLFVIGMLIFIVTSSSKNVYIKKLVVVLF